MELFNRWQSSFYFLLLNPNETKIWIEFDGDNYYLPHVEIGQAVWLGEFQEIKNAIEPQFEIAVNILHYITYDVDKKKRQIKGIYVLEQHNPKQTKPNKNGFWCDSSKLASINFSCHQHKSIVQKYLQEIEDGYVSPFSPPWAKAGWLEEVTVWIKEQLNQLGYQQIESIEYLKIWSISAVLKISTSENTFYFKQASPHLPLFCNEPAITDELATLFPDQIPTIIKIDRQRHWMLMADFGNSTGGDASRNIKEDIYRSYAQIQIRSIPECDRLLIVGCIDRRLDVLQSQIDNLINQIQPSSELSDKEIEQLQSLAPQLKDLCDRLASYNIPQTIVHGDLHLGNVALSDDSYIFFDWTDSCISHPFFDFFELYFSRNQNSFFSFFTRVWKARYQKRLRDRYLSQWTNYEPMERLLEAWNLAKPLCALHHAVTYHSMLNHLEPKSKQELNALPYFIKEIIQSLPSK